MDRQRKMHAERRGLILCLAQSPQRVAVVAAAAIESAQTQPRRAAPEVAAVVVLEL
jgi:hypothetical protein